MTIIRKSDAKVASGQSSYPEPYDAAARLYTAWELSNVAGLSQFGVGLEVLHPGGISSQRHWHEEEDEFLYVLDGELILVENDGEHILTPGDAVGWKAGVANGHHVINRSDRDASYLIVGTRAPHDRVHYPDIDLEYIRDENGRRYTKKDGSPIA